jgi:hypothetical protein
MIIFSQYVKANSQKTPMHLINKYQSVNDVWEIFAVYC